MSSWKEDPRLPYAIAAVLGMIAGVAAKQAVALQTGQFPKPILIIADFMVLGMVWLMAMYTHSKFPGVSIEGIALLSAALAMWGPKGIAALLGRFKVGALRAAEQAAHSILQPVDPISRPTVIEAVDREKEEAVRHEDHFGRTAPIRKLRDTIPVDRDGTPADQQALIGRIDQVDTNPKSEGENND
jgi:hypothetical protein